MKKKLRESRSKGFTLIELLVVISIIGILAMVVFASLDDARATGRDSAIKQISSNIRTQAELVFYLEGSNYATVCTNPRITEMLAAAERQSRFANSVVIDANANNSTVVCNDNDNGFVVAVPLNDPESWLQNAWCVDHTGFASFIFIGSISAGDVSCPTAPPATASLYWDLSPVLHI